MKNIAIVILTVVFLNIAICAQEYQTPDFLTVKTDKGMMVVNNNKPKPFAFLIAGTKVTAQQMENGSLLFMVDGKVLNVVFLRTSAFLGGKKDANEAEILYAHRDWEMDFLSKTWQQTLKPDNDAFVFLALPEAKSLPSLFWSFPRPSVEDSQFDRDSFQSTVVADMMLVLGSPTEPNAKIEDTKRFLKETLSSLSFLPSQMQTPVKNTTATTKPTVKPVPKVAPKTKVVKRKIKKN